MIPSSPRDRSVWMAKDWDRNKGSVILPHYYGIHLKGIRLISYMLYCVSYSFLNKFDMIFCWEAFPAGIIGLIIKFIRKKPLITYIVDNGVNLRRSRSYPSLIWIKMMTRLQDLVVRHSDKLIIIDDSLMPWLKNRAKKIEVIPFGVKINLFTKHPKGNDKINVTYFGGFEPHHGVQLVLKASRILSYRDDLIFNIIGPPKTLEQKNVKFTGWVPYKELGEYLRNTDIFVVPPYPKYPYVSVITNKLMEAMACGKAIIATRIGGIPKFTDSLYLVDPKPEEIAFAINDLISKPELRKKLAFNAKQIAENEFNWKINIQKIFCSIKKI